MLNDHNHVILEPDDYVPDSPPRPAPDGIDFRVAGQLGRRNHLAEVESCCWPGCPADRHPASDAPPLCTKHLISCAVYISDSMTDLIDRNAASRASIAPLHPSAFGEQKTGEVVYYVRVGDHIKIGTTTNLPSRLAALYVDHDPDLVLATEPGGRAVENTRHHEFDAERVYANRELFNPSPRLLAHIARLKDLASKG